ncbi:F-box protein FBW2 [Dendrobium catenatum]|uniref:F-box protein FBW2 n=1 Tax=Dendrobium catenatum TaxID=906689 RepID=A0A2I0W9V2_9ASPA|nr:F-box protein FBW2 [Dendrobium catenatum]
MGDLADLRAWEELIPDALGLIFRNLSLKEILTVVPRVCKAWSLAVTGPYCWREIDIEEWSRRVEPEQIDAMLNLLVRRSCGSFRRLVVSGLPNDSLLCFIAEHLKLFETESSRNAYGDNIENNLGGVQKEYIAVVFKFGGIWVKTNVQHRKRYDGGKQRTVKVEKGELTVSALREEICRICPWLKGHPYNLSYYIYGTSPKEYKEMNSEVEEANFVKLSKDNMRAEIVITVQEVEEHDSNSYLMEFVSSENMVECSYNDVLNAPILCSKDIAVGTLFLDALRFKNALRSVAIRDNFGLVCRGCWRCEGSSFCLGFDAVNLSAPALYIRGNRCCCVHEGLNAPLVAEQFSL